MIEGNIGLMPLKKNVSDPPPSDWKLQPCPVCGQECYYQQTNAAVLKSINPKTMFVCTECALKELTMKERARK